MRDLVNMRNTYRLEKRITNGSIKEGMRENAEIISSRAEESEAATEMFKLLWKCKKDPNLLVLSRLFAAVE